MLRQAHGLALGLLSLSIVAGGCGRTVLITAPPESRMDGGVLDGAVPDGGVCLPPRARCSGDECVDLTRDRANCGACGRLCAEGAVCVGGACVREGCPPG